MNVLQRDAVTQVLSGASKGDDLMTHVRHLCDVIGERPAGSPAEHVASEYLISAFNQVGLSSVRREPFQARHWRRGRASATLTRPVSRVIPTLAMPRTSTASIEAEIVWSPFENLDEFRAIAPKLRGRVCLHRPEQRIRVGKSVLGAKDRVKLAAEGGAAAFLWISNWPGKVLHVGSIDPDVGHMPAFAISLEDGLLMRRLIEEGGAVPRIHLETENDHVEGSSWNVSAEWPGDPDAPIVIISAHYDSHDITPGAFDNAAGTAVVLECARLMRNISSKCTVRFVVFSAEEIGLQGSKAYVAQHAAELSSIRFLLNADGLGAVPSTHFMHVPFRGDLAAYIEGAYRSYNLPVETESVVALNWDHAPFALEGVPVASITARWPVGSMLHYGHTAADTVDKINHDELRSAATCAAALATHVATAEPWPFRRFSPEEMMSDRDAN